MMTHPEISVHVQLPQQSQAPYVAASFPGTLTTKTPGGPRNMTGLYLGTESHESPRRHPAVPPLARARGISRVKTPTEERRYKKVELLRIKEDKRGFSGQPLKGKIKNSAVATGDDTMSARIQKLKNKNTLPKTNPRQFTADNNSRVPNHRAPTYFEYLRPNDSGHQRSLAVDSRVPPIPAVPEQPIHMVNEVDRLARQTDLIGLTECYQKVCQGSTESLLHLLPYKKKEQAKRDSQLRNTGFTVKSYQNPTTAEIMADFAIARPYTTPMTSKLLVPAPYYFKHTYTRSLPGRGQTTPGGPRADSLATGPQRLKTAPSGGTGNVGFLIGNKHHTSPRGSQLEINTVGASGAGSHALEGRATNKEFSASARDASKSGNRSKSLSKEATEIDKKPTEKSDTENTGSAHTDTVSGEVERTETQAEDSELKETDIDTVSGEGERIETRAEHSELKETAERKDTETVVTMDDKENKTPTAETDPTSTTMPDIEVKDEDGQDTSVFIDVRDDEEPDVTGGSRGTLQRQQSISERLMKQKSSESIVVSIKEQAEARGRELEQLLDEHAQIIQEIDRHSEADATEQQSVSGSA